MKELGGKGDMLRTHLIEQEKNPQINAPARNCQMKSGNISFRKDAATVDINDAVEPYIFIIIIRTKNSI
jgi:hypothetical protein